MNKPLAWSHSAISLFQTCPHKFYRMKIVGDVPWEDSPELELGRRVHKALEEYLVSERPLPDDLLQQFPSMQKHADEVAALPGTRYVEYQMAVDRQLRPTGWFAKNAWGRAAADVLVVETGHRAVCVDWKTNKRPKEGGLQARILAFMTFLHFPGVRELETRFVYLRPDTVVTDRFERERDFTWLARIINGELDAIARARNTNSWSKTPSGLCRYCPVPDCEHKE